MTLNKPLWNRSWIVLFALAAAAWGSEPEPKWPWQFTGSILYTSRSLSGTIVSRNAINDGVYGDMTTTADTMGLDKSQSVLLSLGAKYKCFGLGMNYLPTSYKGSGFALVAASGPSGGVFIPTPLESRIDIDMILGNISYDLIQTPDTVFGVGAGLGTTLIDLSIVPETGTALVYDGSQPFGFLTVYFGSRYRQLYYGFSLNGLSMDIDGAYVRYSDYMAQVRYRLHDARTKADLVGGYRQVNFAVELDGDGWQLRSDMSQEGPFLGLSVTY